MAHLSLRPKAAPGEDYGHLLGHSIPTHMDGRFRPDLFVEGGEEGARFETFDGGDDGRYGISEDEEKDLEEKLRGLGYL